MKNIFIFLLGILMLSSVYSANPLTIDNQAYYTYDNTLEDATGNQINSTNNGATSTTGIINNAFAFDGITQYIDSNLKPNSLTEFTLNFWVYVTEATAGTEIMIGQSQTGGANRIYFGHATSRRVQFSIGNSAATVNTISSPNNAMPLNSWAMITGRYDGSNMELFINNISIESKINLGTIDLFYDFPIGAYQNVDTIANFYDGKIDEVSFWNRSLNNSEISLLYNNTAAAQYPYETASSTPIISFDNITGITNNTAYNISEFNISVKLSQKNSNNNINVSYTLDGGLPVQFITNSLTGSVLFNFTEGHHNLTFHAVNTDTTTNSSKFTFIVDKKAPIIEIIGNVSQDTFFINFSNIFNVTDNLSGIDTCTLNITYLSGNETDNDFFINCTDTQTFTRSGFYNGFLQSFDNAGNYISGSINGSINPLINIKFFDNSSLEFIKNYSAIVKHPDGRIEIKQDNNGTISLSPVNNGTLDLGLHIITFQKLGYSTQNFTQIINSSNAGINVTFNVTKSKILVSIFDRETGNLLTGLTKITLLATKGFNGSTITGLLNISEINFISEQYTILAEHTGFSSETVFFNYNNQEIINVNIFMLNTTNKANIKIIVKNSLSQFVEGAVCSALQWNPITSSFGSVSQGLTNVNGETLLNIELNTKIYKFSCTKETFTTITSGQIVQISDSTLTIILNDIILAPTPLFENLVTSLTNTTINSTHQLITYNFADADGLTTEGCIQIFWVNGNRKTFKSESCVSSSTGSILVSININQSSDILVQGVLSTPEIINYVTDKLPIFKGTGDIAFQLKQIGMDILVPTIFILLGLGLGILLSNINIAVILMAIGGWIAVAFVPTVLSGSIAMFISMIVILMLYGGFSRK